MKNGKIINLLPPLYVLLGLGAWKLHDWMMGSFVEDPVSGLLPFGTLPEILIWVLTGCVIAAAFVLTRHAGMGAGSPIIGALSNAFFAAGTLTLLLEDAKGPAALVLVYRVDSVDPALEAYYVELLALVFLTLGFYRLSSFAFGAGRTRRFALYTGAAVVLSLAALTDGAAGISSTLLYLGGALTLLGFLLLRLCRPAGDCEAHHSTGEA